MNQFLRRLLALSFALLFGLNLGINAWAQNAEPLKALPPALVPEDLALDAPDTTTLIPLDDQGLDDIVVSTPGQGVQNGERRITQNQANGVIKEIEIKSAKTRYVVRPPLNFGSQTLQPAMWELGSFNEAERKNSDTLSTPPNIVTPDLPQK